MRKTMSKGQVEFYKDRLTLFFNDSEIADELGVTRPTWIAWKTGETLPPLTKLEQFEAARRTLTRWLHRKNKDRLRGIIGEIADLIARDDPPQFEAPDLPGVSLGILKEELVKQLHGKRVKSSKVIQSLLELGYTRMQIVHAAKKLGVVSEPGKRGRGGYNWWSLK